MANSIRQTDKSDLDEQILDDLENIRVTLEGTENIASDLSMDKQIVAAAYREIEHPKKVKEYRFSFWRKLSLPLYIGSGFIFTVLAYNSLLLPDKQVDSNIPSSTSVLKIEPNEVIVDYTSEAKKREKRDLPILEKPEHMPERVVTESKVTPIDLGTQENQENRLIDQGIYTGNELKKAEFPEKEAWAREIITLLRDGRTLQARDELNQFKKIYPDYPIEEQIKVLTP